jgi:hypothetical protein
MVNNDIRIMAILDTGSYIIVLWQDLIYAFSIPINNRCTIEMEGKNDAINWTVGCVEFLTMQVGNMPFKVHTHIIEKANFSLLLQPLKKLSQCFAILERLTWYKSNKLYDNLKIISIIV